MRLIADGLVDREGIDGLAKALAVTPRHVLRTVTAWADCGPLDLARAQRVRLARILLTATQLPMDDVAAAAGFATVRQFNATIMAFLRVTPGAIRYGRRRATPGEREGGPLIVRCQLPVGRPVTADFLTLLATQAIPDVESGSDHWYARTVRLPHGPGHLRVDRDTSGRLLARLAVTDRRDIAPIYARARAIFVDADSRTAPADPAAAGATDTGEALIRGLIAADRLTSTVRVALGGLAHALGEPTPWGTLFPTPARIAAEARTVLRGEPARTDLVTRAAAALADGTIDVRGAWSLTALRERHPLLLVA